ncbi:DUF4153 domain-containing protein [Alkalibacterium sp.]|nr:MAG: DUF4153 domain-containing protein [Alkalibacterium sp.]
MRARQFFTRLKDQGLLVIRRFPLSILLFFSAALFTSLTIQIDGTSFTKEGYAAGFAAIFLAVSQLTLEGALSRRKVFRYILPGIILLLSLVYYLYLRQVGFFYNQSAMVRTAVLYFTGLILFISVPTIRSKWTFSETLIAFIKAFFSSLLLSVVMYIGIAIIFGTYSTLFSPLSYEWFGQTAAWIFIFFGPVYLLARIPKYYNTGTDSTVSGETNIPPLLSSLIDFIVVPLILIFTGLLIAYIGANITGDFWLDNLIEPMLISYVVVGFLTLYLTEQSDRRWVNLFNRYFPYLLLVIALFQSVSSSIKSFGLGLTHGRYFVLLFGIFAITSVIIYGFFKQFKSAIPFILVGLGLISILPFIDAVSIGVASQKSQIESVIDEDNLSRDYTHDEKMQLSYSFNYLQETVESYTFDWLPDDFHVYENFQSTFGFEPYYYTNTQLDNQYPEPAERTFGYIELNRDSPVVYPIDEADEAVQFATYYMRDESGNNTIELNEPDTILEVTVDEGEFFLELIQDEETILTYDLYFLRDQAFDQPDEYQSLPIEEISFSEENDEAKVTVVVNHFETDREGMFDGDFMVFITYK